MHMQFKSAILAAGLPLLLAGMASAGTALGGEGVQVKITNDGTQDIIVTVYDMNTRPRRVVLTNARINGFTSVPVSLVADARGQAHLAWTATSTDPDFPKCGKADRTGLGNDASVSVHADSSCGA
jgi:hypothetical protein